MEFKPHDYQTMCIDRIVKDKSVGLFLDMGLGKTIITLSAIMELKDRLDIFRVLVIAPKKVAESTWTTESKKWEHTKDLKISKVLGSEKERIAAINQAADIYITNRDNVAWLCQTLGRKWFFDMVVVDESSSFKSPQAMRFKALKRTLPFVKRLIALTGTPNPKSMEDLWSQIYLLDRGERLGEYITHYRTRYFTKDYSGFGYTLKPGAKEAITKKISDICISLKAKDYLELPAIVYNEVPVELDKKALKAYQELEKNMVLSLEDSEITAVSAGVLTNKLSQCANGAIYDEDKAVNHIHDRKLERFTELVEELNGESALVFYNFKHDKDRILKALEKSGLEVREFKSPKDEEDWNKGKIDILLAHPASTAYGINLQYGGRHIIWFSLPWSYELYAQANARLFRQGQEKPVIVHELLCTDTVDHDIKKSLSEKGQNQEDVLRALKARLGGKRDKGTA